MGLAHEQTVHETELIDSLYELMHALIGVDLPESVLPAHRRAYDVLDACGALAGPNDKSTPDPAR